MTEKEVADLGQEKVRKVERVWMYLWSNKQTNWIEGGIHSRK